MAMGESGGASKGIAWAAVISIIVALAQFVAYGIWIGGLSKQVEVNTAWIQTRNVMGVDSRLAVLDQEQIQINRRMDAVDRHVDSTDQALQAHMAEDRDMRDELRSIRKEIAPPQPGRK